MEHVLRFLDNGIQCALPVCDLQHVRLQFGGHVRFGDTSSMLLQGFGQGDTAGGRDHVVPLDVVPGEQLPDDVVPCTLGTQL